MTFNLVDALALFGGMIVLVFVATYLLMRRRLGLAAWAALWAGTSPSTVYFALRSGGGPQAVVEALAAVGVTWLAFVWTIATAWTSPKATYWRQVASSARAPATDGGLIAKVSGPPQPLQLVTSGIAMPHPSASVVIETQAPPPPTEGAANERNVAYLLMGLGAPFAFVGFLLLGLCGGGRHGGEPLLELGADSALTVILAVLVLGGALLVASGAYLLRRSKRPPQAKSDG